MSTSRALAFAVSLLGVATALAAAGRPPSGEVLVPAMGEAVSQHELEMLGRVVLPNGVGLPVGSGSAVEGQDVYQHKCLACHGRAGTEGINDRLAGGQGSLNTSRPLRTVGSYWPSATTIFDYISRAMPYTSPGSLSDDEVYALTAYLLYLNDIIAEQDKVDAGSLPLVEMPNRNGFYWSTEVTAP